MTKLIALFVALTVAIPAAFYFRGNVRSYAALKSEGAHAPGVITKLTCEIHQTFQYQFAVQAQTFTGSSTSDSECGHLQVGAPVVVTYLPNDPKQNTARDAAALYYNEVMSVGLVTLLVPGIIVGALAARLKRHA